jgi:hypothetical protein
MNHVAPGETLGGTHGGDRAPNLGQEFHRIETVHAVPGSTSKSHLCSFQTDAEPLAFQMPLGQNWPQTNRPASSVGKAALTLNTASLRPLTSRMSLRSAAWVVVNEGLRLADTGRRGAPP